MIYPWDIARFRQALDEGLQAPSFEHFRFATIGIEASAIPEVAHVCEPGRVARMKGPASVFGSPAVPQCMSGVASCDLALPPSCTYVIPGGRIVGLTAVLDTKNRLFSPDACVDAATLDQAVGRNRSNAEGFVLRKNGSGTLASFFAPEVPRHFAKRALLLGNLEINNYGSFLIRVLPQLLKAAATNCACDCYIASDRAAWLRQALDLVGLPQKPVFLAQEVCGDTFDEVVIQSTASVEGFLDPQTLQRIMEVVARNGGGAGAGRKLFVSRQLSRTFLPHYRMLTNEADVAARFERRGFEIVHPESLTLAQQITLFAGASCIAGPSGSGMLNAIFAPAGIRVVDIEGFHVTVRQHAKVYASTGKDYAFLFGVFDPADARDNSSRRWSVDLDLVEEAADWLLAA